MGFGKEDVNQREVLFRSRLQKVAMKQHKQPVSPPRKTPQVLCEENRAPKETRRHKEMTDAMKKQNAKDMIPAYSLTHV